MPLNVEVLPNQLNVVHTEHPAAGECVAIMGIDTNTQSSYTIIIPKENIESLIQNLKGSPIEVPKQNFVVPNT